jgi:hypothetical protein
MVLGKSRPRRRVGSSAAFEGSRGWIARQRSKLGWIEMRLKLRPNVDLAGTALRSDSSHRPTVLSHPD